MNRERLIEFIKETLPMSQNKVEEIASTFQNIEIAKGEYFIKYEKINNKYLFLEKGFIRSYTYDLEGNEVTTNFYSEKQIVFEVASFFQGTSSKENFQALEDCIGCYITYEQLQTLFHNIPEFREFGRMILVKGFIAFKQRTL